MRTINIFCILIFCLLLYIPVNHAQDIYAYKFIGKTRAEVVNNYGKPIHMDNSDPTMVCMFYKKNKDRMVFVSDESSIFQVEALKVYSSEASAESALTKLLNEVSGESFQIDTLSSGMYELNKPGCKFSAELKKNDNYSQFEIRVKAARI